VAESFDPVNLPHFRDRLPDLFEALHTTAHQLKKISKHHSYLPYWEDLYSVLHSLKGVTQILPCEPELVETILALNNCMMKAYSGPFLIREHEKVSGILLQLKNSFSQIPLATNTIKTELEQLQKTFILDIDHKSRTAKMPPALFYINEFVSKKFRETELLHLNHCVIEDEILLQEIPNWRKKLEQFLDHPEFGRGFIINFLPFISSEGSRKVKVWTWIALATPTRAALKQQVKEHIPSVHISKL